MDLTSILEPILWVIFTLGCIGVSGIILIQEGKGGGLGDAFGGAGAQTFGVKAAGIAKVTGYMAGGLVVVALAIALLRSDRSDVTFSAEGGSSDPAPVTGSETGGAGAGSTEQDG